MAGTDTTYDPYVKAGLDKAQSLISSSTAQQYTPYTSSAKNAPTQTQMFDYQAAAPMQQINAPNYQLSAGTAPQYQGLMGGDYNSLQSALEQPGQIAAQNAYSSGMQNLNNTMSGKGLYGSSIMGNQMNQGLNREYVNALATNSANAAAQRYGMEQTDLKNMNDFGLNLYAQKLAEQKDLNAYNSSETAGLRDQALNTANFGLQQSDMLNQYNTLKYNAQKEYDTNLNNWQNQQNYEQNYLYPQAKQAFEQAQQEMLINQALALAGQGAPLSTAATNAQLKSQEISAQQAAAQKNYEAQLWGAGAGLLGTGLSAASNYYKAPATSTATYNIGWP